ncbi:asparagine synthase (glutamine-hydrolyzing) [Rhodoferax saidenbachensis]|uniref:asparagine synthase (glutamine-hydrolyzing) n=2 Tax=Rhodoferax saidenbachensis TaxID=1484693 RepID=A0ABU1ZKQ4_9BURK|nr:asparagine synthase (glutamine-hydrolyzing) [Rhodoferax saidenbachensis]
MVAAIKHRGPDGRTFLEHGDLAVGMCRLSINDLEGGTQPLYNKSGSVAVFYNGEIYNYRELRRELEASGVQFRTHCDGEVIGHLYDIHGEKLFERLDGMFAIALLDRRSDKLILARDIPGEKPLYYYEGTGGDLAFASELPALRHFPGIDLSLSRQALWDMPTFLWVPEPATVYEKVRTLPRSHYMVVEKGSVSVHPYANRFTDIAETLDTPEALVAEVRRVVEKSIKSRLLSDVPVGSFLSGGLDSSIVATIAAREKGHIDTFSIGFEALADPYHGMADESEQAAETARLIKSTHHAIHVTGKDFLDELDTFIAHAGQPYAVSSGLGILAIAKAARAAGIKVLLSGDGADECFGGYSWYAHLEAMERANATGRAGFGSMQNVGQSLETRLGEIKAGNTAERAWGWHFYAHESEKARLFASDFQSGLQTSLRHFNADGKQWRTIDYIAQDRNFYFPNEMLPKVDRMTMAYCVEGRVPFAAPEVLSLAARLNLDQMVSKTGVLKWALRQAFSDVLPAHVLARPKHGFNVPIDHWLRNDWAHLVDETFAEGSALRKHGFVGAKSHAVALEMINNQSRLSGHAIFSLIMMNRWLENHAR